MEVKNYPANNKPTFSLKLDPQVKLNIVQMKASLKLYKLIYSKSNFNC